MTAMIFQRVLPGALALLVSTSCVTINVYLPTKQIREAAREIVDEVRPRIGAPQDGAPQEGVPQDEHSVPADGSATRVVPVDGAGVGGREEARRSGPEAPSVVRVGSLAVPVMTLLVGSPSSTVPARSQGGPEKPGKKPRLNVSTPKIKAIKKTLRKRYAKLHPFYTGLAVGEGRDGYLALRSDKGLGLKQKRDLKLLVRKENADRKQLYTELAAANEIDRKEVPSIGALFSEQWQKKCRTGWWIQDRKGKWARKKPPKKKKQG